MIGVERKKRERREKQRMRVCVQEKEKIWLVLVRAETGWKR